MKYLIRCLIEVVDEAGVADAEKSEFVEFAIETDATLAAAAAYVENCPAKLGLVGEEEEPNVVVTLLSVDLETSCDTHEVSAAEIDEALSLDPDVADSDEDISDEDSADDPQVH